MQRQENGIKKYAKFKVATSVAFCACCPIVPPNAEDFILAVGGPLDGQHIIRTYNDKFIARLTELAAKIVPVLDLVNHFPSETF